MNSLKPPDRRLVGWVTVAGIALLGLALLLGMFRDSGFRHQLDSRVAADRDEAGAVRMRSDRVRDEVRDAISRNSAIIRELLERVKSLEAGR